MAALGWLLNLFFKGGGIDLPSSGVSVEAVEGRARRPEMVESRTQLGPIAEARARRAEEFGFSGTDGSVAPPVTAVEDEWTHIVLASDFSTGSTTAVSTTLEFTPSASKAYWVKGVLGIKTTNTARPVRLGLAFPTGLDDQAHWIGLPHTNSASGLTVGVFGPDGVGVIAAGTSAPDNSNFWYAELEGILVCGAGVSGKLIIEMFVAAPAGATATLAAGSWIAYQELA